MNIKEITGQSEWESFWERTSPQSLFQSWQWGDVERELGKKIWRFGYYHGNTLIGIFQVVKVVAKRGNFLHVRHGPIFSEWKVALIKDWVSWMRNMAIDKRCSFVRISPLIDKKVGAVLFSIGFRSAPIHHMDAEVTIVLDVTKPEQELLANMRKTTRYLVRKAEKLGVTVTSGIDEDKLKEFMSLFKQTAERAGFVENRGLEKEFAIFKKNNKALILFAYYQYKLLAGSLILFSGNQGIYHFAASSSFMREIPAAYLLQWEAIKETKRRGMHSYNLWGGIADSVDPSHPWYGLTLFKQGFGGDVTSYQHALDLPVDFTYWKTYVWEQIIKYIRGYERIGPFRSPPWLRRLVGV